MKSKRRISQAATDTKLSRLRLIFGCIICAVAIHRQTMKASEPNSMAATAINALGMDLLHRTGKANENALISPYSIQSAMAMAYAGAEGATRDEMARVLHYPKDEVELHQSFAELRATLNREAKESAQRSEAWKKYGGSNDPVTLSIANRLFGQNGYAFRTPFVSLLKDAYDAPFEPMDFVHGAPAATKRINEWVESQTHERIRAIIPDGVLNPLTRLVLVNAVYLKAPWEEKFPIALTKPGPFHLNGGKGVEVQMMNRTDDFPYAKGKGFSMVKLPYSGYKLWFLIILPDKVDGLADVESKLSATTFRDAKWEMSEVNLHMPRLKLEPPPLSLGQTFQAMGMKTAFDNPPGGANFDRMAPRRPNDYLLLSDVFHKTFLKLDEEGTEAAAATAVAVAAAGIRQEPKRVEMKVDHPFLFGILHAPSGALLFLGRVADPR
jgi:serpin B